MHDRLAMYKIDICDQALMRYVFDQEKPDVICHLAARAGVRFSTEDPQEYFRTNVMGTLTVLEMARQFDIKHVVCASSSSVYGERENGPFFETDAVEKQSSLYGTTKRTGELLTYAYHHLFGISITNLRFFTVYGPRARVDMAPFIFMDAIYHDLPITVYGDGSAIRDFTYVDDIVDGVIKSIDTSDGYQILNLGRGEPILLTDFIALMEQVVGKKAGIEYGDNFAGDVSMTHASIEKAQSLIGYDPHVSVASGLAFMYEWYKNEYLLLADAKTCIKKHLFLDEM
jgi:UDP-glucuronate 4-epimerase